MYGTVTEYLSQKYSRNASFSVIYISFLDEGLDLHPYAAAQGSSKYNLLRNYTDNILPAARECIGDADAGIFFFSVDGNLYMVRNLLDNRFQPYALMVMGLEKSVLLQSLYSVNGILGIELSIDGVRIPLDAEPIDDGSINPVMTEYTAEVEGHSLAFTAQTMKVSICIPPIRICNRNPSFSHCRFNLLGDANSKAQPAQIERCNKGMADSLSIGHISPRSE